MTVTPELKSQIEAAIDARQTEGERRELLDDIAEIFNDKDNANSSTVPEGTRTLERLWKRGSSKQGWKDIAWGAGGFVVVLVVLVGAAEVFPENVTVKSLSLILGVVGFFTTLVALWDGTEPHLKKIGLTNDSLGLLGLGVSLASIVFGTF